MAPRATWESRNIAELALDNDLVLDRKLALDARLKLPGAQQPTTDLTRKLDPALR